MPCGRWRGWPSAGALPLEGEESRVVASLLRPAACRSASPVGDRRWAAVRRPEPAGRGDRRTGGGRGDEPNGRHALVDQHLDGRSRPYIRLISSRSSGRAAGPQILAPALAVTTPDPERSVIGPTVRRRASRLAATGSSPRGRERANGLNRSACRPSAVVTRPRSRGLHALGVPAWARRARGGGTAPIRPRPHSSDGTGSASCSATWCGGSTLAAAPPSWSASWGWARPRCSRRSAASAAGRRGCGAWSRRRR